MPLARVAAIMRHVSGQPRDVFVNTFHFDCPVLDVANAEVIAERVRNFYVDAPLGVTPLADFYGDQVAEQGHEIKVWSIDIDTDRTLPVPGSPPLWVEAFDHLGRIGDVNRPGLPSEVALRLSYKSNANPAVPPRQKRGGIMFGPPRATENVEGAGADQRPRPTDLLRNGLLEAGQRLRAENDLAATWVVYSRPFEGRPETPRPGRTTLPELPPRDGAIYPIDVVSVDDAWDTVRRRGERAVVKVTG